MPLLTKLPTANETPDSGQGGSAVTGNTNTGHSATTSNGPNGASQTKTCRWSGFTSGAGQIQSVTLKVTHTSNGSLSGAGAFNQFILQYTLNGGGAWTTAVSRTSFTSSSGPTVFSVSLPVTQNLTQVQVRDSITASSVDVGENASATVTISSIQIEAVTRDGAPVVIM